MSDFDFNELRKKLSYNPHTGVFTWNASVSRSVKVGSIAGTRNSHGYIQIRIGKNRVAAHRLAWAFTHGDFPTCVIDHINGVKDDNRISNLREVTTAENGHNQRKPHSRTSSGYLGVSWVKRSGKWQAGLGVNGKFKFLGLFDDPELAHQAYLEAKRIHHPSAPVH